MIKVNRDLLVWSWNWEKIDTTREKASKATKEKSGCVVKIDHSGELDIACGVVRPKGEGKGKGASKDGEDGGPAISNALHQRLSVQATGATVAALADEPRLGLVALLAGFVARRSGSPVRVSLDGLNGEACRSDEEDFAAAFGRLNEVTDEDLFRIAGGIAGAAMDLCRHNAANPIFDTCSDPLATAIDPGRMLEALREAFDAEDYFRSAPKAVLVKAIEEAINSDEARKAGKLKKAELVEHALANVPATGWLPVELRPSTYNGPMKTGAGS